MDDLQFVLVDKENQHILENVVQIYMYDLNNISDKYVLFTLDENGRFPFVNLSTFITEPNKYAYLTYRNSVLIGMILVHQQPFYPHKTQQNFVISEFFVLRMYRRHGFGLMSGQKLLELHQGAWEIRVSCDNIKGQKFWRSFVEHMTNYNYNYKIMNKKDSEWNGIIINLALTAQD